MKLKIEVTQDDIDHGCDTPGNCPVARAVDRALAGAGYDWLVCEFAPYACWVEARGLEIFRKHSGNEALIRVPVSGCPDEACEFAQDFDDWYRYDPDEDEDDEDDDDDDEEEDEPPPCPSPFTCEWEIPLEGIKL